MNSRRRAVILIAAVLALCAALPAAAEAKNAVHARLTPTGTAGHGSGTFSARGGTASSTVTVTVRWKLSVRNLSGSVRQANLHSSGIVLSLCRRCRAR